MKYSFSFYKDPLGTLRIKLPEEVDMFSDFIEQIALKEEADEFINIIDKVIDGTHDEYEIFFNAPTVVIGPHITSVSLADILDEPPPDEYMETEEFRKLILVWKERNFNH
ncbi:tRNA-Val4 [Cerasibacillus terrae]|uniref:tRNA-Val4 n=1 Tax=Cerasibacillus terrae TaxID=2498845 RepID=A0A5C8P0G3_9BACI|nr:tRNA-Val4 [Cerasibacillus terrae]TXL66752.1 tRNA-Val4 [Cerasibacillus terrae]